MTSNNVGNTVKSKPCQESNEAIEGKKKAEGVQKSFKEKGNKKVGKYSDRGNIGVNPIHTEEMKNKLGKLRGQVETHMEEEDEDDD